MSNALERSKKTPSVYSPFSKESVISCVGDLGEMFHKVVKKKFVLLVMLLNSELPYKFFCNHILFVFNARQCYYNTKLVL